MWDVSDGGKQAAIVKPFDPFERFPFDGGHGFPWTKPVNDLSFVEAIYGFSQGIVIGIANAANRGFDPCQSQSLGIANGQILPVPLPGSGLLANHERGGPNGE